LQLCSNRVQQNSAVFQDQAEWQMLRTNVHSMILDVRTIYNQRVERSHHGRPNVISWEHTGSAGRPRTIIDPNFLRWAYGRRSTSGIAQFLGVSSRTVRRALLDNDIVSPGLTPFSDTSSIQSSSSSNHLSNMSNDDLDAMIRMLRSHYPTAGIRMLDGMLRRLALRAHNNNRSETVLSLFMSA
ncbi:hypothetical protein F5880DRAFT_1445668, partial [Lentinula raphanica]